MTAACARAGLHVVHAVGDPDAAVSQEKVVKKMTDEEIQAALVLVEDYRRWIYPFR